MSSNFNHAKTTFLARLASGVLDVSGGGDDAGDGVEYFRLVN
nr:3708_t:CDS:2 [Entrophospora candida]